MSDNKKKGRKRGAGVPKPEPSKQESDKAGPQNFESKVPAKEPEIVPEKADSRKARGR